LKKNITLSINFSEFSKKQINNKIIHKLGEFFKHNQNFIINININDTNKIETFIEEMLHFLFYLYKTHIKKINNEEKKVKKMLDVLKNT